MLVAFNKPWGVLCQFSSETGEGPMRPTLADFIDQAGVYPAGRLDLDSEGLLLLTDDGKLQHQIASPKGKREGGYLKSYLVQVEGTPGPAQINALTTGVKLNDGPASAVSASLLFGKPGWLWPREKPVQPRKGKSTAWLELVLDEGRNRQVRRMTAAVGLPTLRLVRHAIGPYKLGELAPGQWRRIE